MEEINAAYALKEHMEKKTVTHWRECADTLLYSLGHNSPGNPLRLSLPGGSPSSRGWAPGVRARCMSLSMNPMPSL